MEKIEVGYRKIGFGHYHKFIIYTDSTGVQWAASGWAGGLPSSVPAGDFSQAQSGSGGGFGNIITTIGRYDSSYPDHPDYGSANNEYQIELIKTGNDLSQYWESIKTAMNDIANGEYQ
ncbi:MAG TPA: hypothetical protein VEC06_05140 [Paucimonas sp.]|nr:hypothetical protein [Paucimonas sp.]